ncbi:nitrite reductase small subunit NirD [Pseudonocardia yuanmonensis]|uniref:Nitrite reductase small subunit NirD n=1 Tax=Pseudonocardia yuanmonensis TaxID=1095914 RepID=A0ABP8WIP3_9PSEU
MVTTTDERPVTDDPGTALRWETACRLERLQPERGVAALFGDQQVAIFRTHAGELYAIGNIDPKSGAAVLSRGIVGDRGGEPTVASPVYKESFSLVDGRCLDAPGVSVPAYPVRVHDGRVQIGLR